MSKLFQLKEWLTLDETRHICRWHLGEHVQKKDTLRLSLDGHLRLSVDLVNGARARCGLLGGPEDVVYFDSTSASIFTPEMRKKS